MSDIPKEVEKMLKKDAAFICADVWSDVFDLLPPYQLGLRMALVSGRFDVLVDGHFATRKWTFGSFEIRSKRTKSKEVPEILAIMKNGKMLPIPDEDIPLPTNVVGFEYIKLSYIGSLATTFLHKILPLIKEKSCTLTLTKCCPLKELVNLSAPDMHYSFQSLKYVISKSPDHFPELSADGESANVLSPLSKWLLTARANGIPKVLYCEMHWEHEHFLALMETLKEKFRNSSSSANFIISVWIMDYVNIVPFALCNELTGEQLVLKQWDEWDDDGYVEIWLLVRSPIERNETQWAKWEAEAIAWEWDSERWNHLDLRIDEEWSY